MKKKDGDVGVHEKNYLGLIGVFNSLGQNL
jgi:hypothetical protein